MIYYKCTGCMNPTSGSFTINPRLQRHFSGITTTVLFNMFCIHLYFLFLVFAVNFPNAESLTTIYHSILSSHFVNAEQKFNPTVTKIGANIVTASLALHNKVTQIFLPTAVKFHYIFNLRDLSNIFQGLLFSTSDCLATPVDIIRLWLHESHRVYGDKLTDEKDIDSFTKMQTDIVKKSFEDIDESIVFEKPNIYSHFANGIGEPKYMPNKDWQSLTKLLLEAQNSYNDLVAAMNLVLFEDAMMHICR